MIDLRNILKPQNAWQHCKMLCYLMVLLITLQSTLVMKNSHICDATNKNFSNQHLQTKLAFTEQVSDKKSILKQEISHDECLDCNCNACPCCSHIVLSLVSIKYYFSMLTLSISDLESSQIDTPYYTISRPPKPLDIYIS
ncbi:hypothetical protein [Pseudoalteromonas denitrificans]|uniref:Uncharacterized protein n=1 Tax=Pseudoalteromonas denitrificans DSM 6059 TaxID=1123010 RepID=A0A1I1TT76_9GAMM|nr:hypothetical protein [Pseudoalteromonas denitrificans]SFD60428.1 hypothetical protein SAMN02745724_04955 [Pseudoalteromonas denitrificans DSM 6059]